MELIGKWTCWFVFLLINVKVSGVSVFADKFSILAVNGKIISYYKMVPTYYPQNPYYREYVYKYDDGDNVTVYVSTMRKSRLSLVQCVLEGPLIPPYHWNQSKPEVMTRNGITLSLNESITSLACNLTSKTDYSYISIKLSFVLRRSKPVSQSCLPSVEDWHGNDTTFDKQCGYIQHWYYNQALEDCRFNYVGCKVNRNLFDSKKICQDTCIQALGKAACRLPYTRGPCRNPTERWYYDIRQEKCSKFLYGGCDGNTNNFKSLKDCNVQCDPQAVTVTDNVTTTAPEHRKPPNGVKTESNSNVISIVAVIIATILIIIIISVLGVVSIVKKRRRDRKHVSRTDFVYDEPYIHHIRYIVTGADSARPQQALPSEAYDVPYACVNIAQRSQAPLPEEAYEVPREPVGMQWKDS